MRLPQVFYEAVRLKPVGDKIVCRPIEQQRRTSSGLIMPTDDREAPLIARVLAVGEGRVSEKRVMLRMPIKQGDVILYQWHAGTPVKGGEKPAVLILELDDVLAIVTQPKKR